MAAPEIDAIYPSDGGTGIPLGADITITFSSGIDLASGKANVVIYGRDYDQTSGPESAAWIDSDTGNNPYFLRSPGFGGIVECTYSVVYVDGSGAEIDPQPSVTSEADELAGDGADPYRHKLVITPKSLLAPEVDYSVYIIGDSEGGTSSGISKRIVYDVDSSSATSTTGAVSIYGGYTGTSDEVHIKITTAGDIGAAKYKWWYDSLGEGSATEGKVTSRRYRRLEDGLQVRFTGSGFNFDDEYVIALYTPEYLADSFNFTFTSGTGSVISVPSTASTSVIGTESSLDADVEYLTVESMDPPDGATHQSNNTREIQITFSADLDSTTVTDDTVTVLSYPVSGTFSGVGSASVVELSKGLDVDHSTLTIKL